MIRKMYANKRKIKKLANKIGFDIVKITDAKSFKKNEASAVERVRSGLMDGLPWYSEERAILSNNPKKLMHDAESIISLAICYNNSDKTPLEPGPHGKIAKYAWGDDYHEVIKKMLRTFVKELQETVDSNIKTRIFVDDGPMNDRAAAERSGVGWFGKNTNILTSKHGSWVFLAQVITNLKLQIDKPLKKTCGDCVKCIVACPTNAIVAPYIIDNTKCISFLTIELRGSIPIKMRPLIGDWIFGCDICQDVCPVNLKVEIGTNQSFNQRNGFSAPQLIPLMNLTQTQFSEKFRNSPIKRAKYRGFLRNVCVALGNIKDPISIPALVMALYHDESLVRSHAAWAIGNFNQKNHVPYLQIALKEETNPEVIQEIQLAIDASNLRKTIQK